VELLYRRPKGSRRGRSRHLGEDLPGK
jgi:hypothetical protein